MDLSNTQLEPGATPEFNQIENHANMASLLEQEGLGLEFPCSGEIRQGVIASISPNQILVSVGSKSEGVISGKEFELISQEELAELKVGQEIPVYVINPEDQNGNLVLSFVRAREEGNWLDAEKYIQSKENFHSKIIGYNKGGLIVPLGNLRGFVPASQLSLSRRAGSTGDTPDQRWSKMVGEEVDVCVIEVDRERRRLILSERAATPETREMLKDRVIIDLNEGDVRTGRVTSLAEFGAFVNINGADGLVHLSEISWDRIQHPGEFLKVGQEVKVKIINIDRDKKRIGLSIRQLQDDPWSERAARYQVGQLVQATISRLTKFGAFAKLDDDIEGLIHISEISERRIEHPKEVLHEGDDVTLRVLRIEPDNHRIGLSLRRVESMAYADMDWQALQEVAEGSGEPVVVTEVSSEKQIIVESKTEKKTKTEKEPKTVKEPETEEEPKAEKDIKAKVEKKPVKEPKTKMEPVSEAEIPVEPSVIETSEEPKPKKKKNETEGE